MNKAIKSRPYFRLTDILVLVIILLTSLGGFFIWGAKTNSSAPKYAYIKVNTVLTETIYLPDIKESYNITIEGNFPVTLRVSRDGISFEHSQCKDKLCIHSGLIGSGQSAACLPAGVSVSVSGNNSDIDATLG